MGLLTESVDIVSDSICVCVLSMLDESALPLIPSLLLLLLHAAMLKSNPKLTIDNVILTNFIIFD
jgi:hypothetical protein